MVACIPRVNRISAGKHIDGCISEFWPGVYCKVTFGNHNHSAYTLGGKLVKGHFAYFRTGPQCRLHHNILHPTPIVQYLRITPVCLTKNVTAQSMNHCLAPFHNAPFKESSFILSMGE